MNILNLNTIKRTWGSHLLLLAASLFLIAGLFSTTLHAAPRVSVSPMIKRLSDANLKSSDLEISTKITLAKATEISLEIVEPSQNLDGSVAWVKSTDKNPLFKLPFKKKLLGPGVHVIQFKKSSPSLQAIKPILFAVAISSSDKAKRARGKGKIKFQANIELRQIFQITHPGSVRGVARYGLSMNRVASEKDGVLNVEVKNTGAAPYYINPSIRIISESSAHLGGASRDMFLKADLNSGAMLRREIPVYPGSTVQISTDVSDLDVGKYNGTTSIKIRDRIGSRHVFRSVGFEKTSKPKKRKVSDASLALKIRQLSSKATLGGREVTFVSLDTSGMANVSVKQGGAACTPQSSTALLKKQGVTRLFFRDLGKDSCVIQLSTGEKSISIKLDDGFAAIALAKKPKSKTSSKKLTKRKRGKKGSRK